MSDAELEALDRKRGAWSRAHFIRKAITLSGKETVVETAPILAQLSKVGGNINQIARQLNRQELGIDQTMLQLQLRNLAAVIEHLQAL
ncbi:hypothetical protein M2345_001558 [Sphingobium sp. B8D3D]|nr:MULTISPECIES: plasmid mobilization relaxosome protein MobC [unclassified Sphingobium]MCW2411799.1 hypothetical protein [Sphingobium sp. B8D3D]